MGGSDSKVDSSESSKQKEGGGSEENKYGECSCQVVFVLCWLLSHSLLN